MRSDLPAMDGESPSRTEPQGDKVAEEHRAIWEAEMGHPLTPVRHDHTAVLMLSWHKSDTDDQGAADEASIIFHVLVCEWSNRNRYPP